MFPAARLKFLHERKQELLVQSEVNRRLAQVLGAEIHERVAWVDRAASIARRAWPFLGLALPLWRFLKATRESSKGSSLRKLAPFVPLLGNLSALARRFFGKRRKLA